MPFVGEEHILDGHATRLELFDDLLRLDYGKISVSLAPCSTIVGALIRSIYGME